MPGLHGRDRGEACYPVVIEVSRTLTATQPLLLEEYRRSALDEKHGPSVGAYGSCILTRGVGGGQNGDRANRMASPSSAPPG